MADTNLWKPEVRVGGQQEGVLPISSRVPRGWDEGGGATYP